MMKMTCVAAVALATMLVGLNPAGSQERPNSPAGLALSSAKKSHVEITISKETTYITGPLRTDGYVNYVAALNRHLRAGVTPENNAAVFFLKAMGPGEIGPKYPDEYYRLLGIQPLPEKGDYFVKPDTYVKALKDAGPATAEEEISLEIFGDQLILAMKGAWSKKEFPILARWLAANEKPLALLVAASRCPRRYNPLSPEDDCVLAALLAPNSYLQDTVRGCLLASPRLRDDGSPGQWQYRAPARALTASAMLRVEEGKVDEAWEDLLACHRLARLVGQGPTLNDVQSAVALEGMACAGDQGLLQRARLAPAQIARMRAELDKLPPLPRMVDKINVGERSIYLDTVATLARRGYSRLFAHDGGLTQGMLFLLVDLGAKEAIDWDHVLRIGNSWYDQVADAYGRPTRAERMTALDKTERDRRRRLDTSAKVMKSPGVWMPAGMRCAASERCGQVLLSIIPPRVQACADAEDRRTMQFNLTRLAFALAAYHADRGTYPVRLADLTPHYLAEVPRDIFNDSELHYRQEAGGYLLYSVGINGRDDGGKGYDDEQKATENVKNGEAYTWEGWDDISVCVPAATEQKP